MLKRFWAVLAAAMTIAAPQLGHSADFPNRPIKIVVPYPAGGSTDVLMRVMAPVLQSKWGVPVVIENRAGAGSIIGATAVAKAPADGYTLGIVANAFSVNPSLRENMPYDTLKDFTPLTQLTFTPNVLVGNTGENFKTMKELQEAAKSGKKTLSSGSIGNGTAAHLALEKLKALSGMNILHVPFQGSAPGMTALLGGQTNLLIAPLPDVVQYVRAGKAVALHFDADWCPTCRAQEKVLNGWKGDSAVPGTLLIVNYDNDRELRKKLGVRTQSTVIVYKGATEKARRQRRRRRQVAGSARRRHPAVCLDRGDHAVLPP